MCLGIIWSSTKLVVEGGARELHFDCNFLFLFFESPPIYINSLVNILNFVRFVSVMIVQIKIKQNECIRELRQLILRNDVEPNKLHTLTTAMVTGSNNPIISSLQCSALFEFLSQYFPLDEKVYMQERNMYIEMALKLT